MFQYSVFYHIYPKYWDTLTPYHSGPKNCTNQSHEMSKPIFWENKENINLLSAEFAQKVIKVHVVDVRNCHMEPCSFVEDIIILL